MLHKVLHLQVHGNGFNQKKGRERVLWVGTHTGCESIDLRASDTAQTTHVRFVSRELRNVAPGCTGHPRGAKKNMVQLSAGFGSCVRRSEAAVVRRGAGSYWQDCEKGLTISAQ